jgi:phosphate transport system protein
MSHDTPIADRGVTLRTAFHDRLDALASDLGATTLLVADAMDLATHALLTADLAEAERVINGDAQIDDYSSLVEQHCVELIALQSPVAEDLRVVIGALRISASLERMGDLAEHVAKQARMRFPDHAVPTELEPSFAEMGRIGVAMTRKVAEIITSRDIAHVAQIEAWDSEVDALRNDLLATLQSPDWAHGPTTAVDLTLLARYFERFADHAVSVTRRVVAIVTGDPYVGVRLEERGL